MNRSRLTRCLHGLVAIAVVHQLSVSLLMQAPEEGEVESGLGGLLFEFHETVGLVTFGIILAYWLWSLMRRGETSLGQLVPWFSAPGLAALGDDLREHWHSLRRRQGPKYQPAGPLASAVHGLGLLAVTMMTLTGTLWWLTESPAGLSSTLAEGAKEVHELFAPLVWTYLIGHAAIGVWHSLRGHRAIQTMFQCRRGAVPVAEERETP